MVKIIFHYISVNKFLIENGDSIYNEKCGSSITFSFSVFLFLMPQSRPEAELPFYLVILNIFFKIFFSFTLHYVERTYS